MPGGLIVTQEIEQFIRTLVAPFRYTSDFDALPIPFRAVATDMVAGEVVSSIRRLPRPCARAWRCPASSRP